MFHSLRRFFACRCWRHLLLLGTLSLGSVGCKEQNTFQAPPPPQVTVANPAPATVTDALELTGVTEPMERVEITARVEGFLQEAPFTEGENVAEGQLLFVIDPRPFQADLDAAEAALLVAQARRSSADAGLKQAEAQAENDKAQYNRSARAAESGAVTAAELDELRTKFNNAVAEIDVARAAIASADAEIKAAEATVKQKELDYSYTQVKSPLAGRVGKRQVDIGNLVGSGSSTLLTNVIKYDPIYAVFTISESELLRFIRRSEEKGESPGPKTRENSQRVIRLGLSDEEGFPHEGKFDYADLGVDQSTGTYLVRALFPNPNLTIPIGAFVRIEVPMEPRPCMLLDDAAIGRDQNGAYVSVLNAEDVVSRKRITTGPLYQGQRVVWKGLEANDRVVVNGIQKAIPGAKVTVTATEPAKASKEDASNEKASGQRKLAGDKEQKEG